MKVKKQKISEKLFYTGLIEPGEKINITPDVGGKIAKIYVEEGDFVRKGQLLAELDTRAIRLQFEQAKAALAVAEANLKDAEKNKERMERLKKENAVSDQQYEKVKLAFEAAEAQHQQAKAAVNLAQYNLDVSIMNAPFNGIVASLNADVGDVINPMMSGFSPSSGVMTLMDFSKVKIEIKLSHRDIVRIRKGQAAFLRVDAYPGEVFEGIVSIVNQAADPLSKKFMVEVIISNEEMLLRPNTYGEIALEVKTHQDALVIPQDAVIENKYVFLVSGDTVEKKEVVLGIRNSNNIEVLQGLQENDLIIVEGNYGLEEGIKIEVKEVVK
jgi:RND family efflux transporter MFP subunit